MEKVNINLLNNSKVIIKSLAAIIAMTVLYCLPIFAAKYTIANGIDFNVRIKLAINSQYTSATQEKTISAFKCTNKMPNDYSSLIDISEDGDSSYWNIRKVTDFTDMFTNCLMQARYQQIAA